MKSKFKMTTKTVRRMSWRDENKQLTAELLRSNRKEMKSDRKLHRPSNFNLVEKYINSFAVK
jgi:hypothetical protein